MQFTQADHETLLRLLAWRRDVRHFLADPLPEGTASELRRALDLAPSVGNARPWRVIEVASAEFRAAVHELFLKANAEAAAAQDAARRDHYARLKLEGMRTAPLQLAVFTDTAPVEGGGLGRHSMPETLEQSTAMAVQNSTSSPARSGWASEWFPSSTHAPWNACSKYPKAGASICICALDGLNSPTTRRSCIAMAGSATRRRAGAASEAGSQNRALKSRMAV